VIVEAQKLTESSIAQILKSVDDSIASVRENAAVAMGKIIQTTLEQTRLFASCAGDLNVFYFYLHVYQLKLLFNTNAFVFA
jgi:hypothetical protein